MTGWHGCCCGLAWPLPGRAGKGGIVGIATSIARWTPMVGWHGAVALALATRRHAAISCSGDARCSRAVEAAVVRALFPNDRGRRAFLRAVGATTALAAIA